MLDLEFRKYFCAVAGDVKKGKFKIQNDIHFWILTYKMQLLVVFEGLVLLLVLKVSWLHFG